jgi:hypothetical protein
LLHGQEGGVQKAFGAQESSLLQVMTQRYGHLSSEWMPKARGRQTHGMCQRLDVVFWVRLDVRQDDCDSGIHGVHLCLVTYIGSRVGCPPDVSINV